MEEKDINDYLGNFKTEDILEYAKDKSSMSYDGGMIYLTNHSVRRFYERVFNPIGKLTYDELEFQHIKHLVSSMYRRIYSKRTRWVKHFHPDIYKSLSTYKYRLKKKGKDYDDLKFLLNQDDIYVLKKSGEYYNVLTCYKTTKFLKTLNGVTKIGKR